MNTFTATPAPASAPLTRPAGPAAWRPSCKTNALFTKELLLTPGAEIGCLPSDAPKSRHEGEARMKTTTRTRICRSRWCRAVQALTLLKGQTALVTGANSGIGRAIAISLGQGRRQRGRELRRQARGSRGRGRGNSQRRAARHDRAGRCLRRSAGAGDVRRRGARVRHRRHSREQCGHGTQRAVSRDDRRAMGRAS